ncbi:MAG: chemotaxis protein [Silicimonas sp.]|nr:chemotaxis protein [Silicimonas sp.]
MDEVFFSRTDERGVILSGNYIFRRVANYDWTELLGAPHKLVRHPDMPKGVFWLWWDGLRRGEAVGAYVKNLAKDGLHYWVFSSVVPCAGGYMSVRIKPTSPVFEIVQDEYAKLLKLEKEEDIAPEESADLLLTRLRDLGFTTYSQFEAYALSEELLARNAGLGRKQDERIDHFKSMLEAANRLKDATSTLIREFEAVRIIPHNMRVMASRLEPTGGPFNTLSSNYGTMSSEISEWFESHVVGEDSNFSTISDSVYRSMFLEGIVGILHQCDVQLNAERRMLGEIDIDAERGIISIIAQEYRSRSKESLDSIHDETQRIQQACKVMSRHVLGLSTARVMCKIESARMGSSGEGLADIIGQLGRFQDKIGGLLTEIAKLGEDIQMTSLKGKG